MHQKVEDLSFSPCETYLITYRYLVHPNLDPDDAIIVWDIRSGAKLRNFSLKNPLDLKFQVQATITLEDSKQKKQIEKVIRGRVKAYEGDSSSGYFTIEEGSIVHDRVEPSKVVPLQDPNRLKWSPDGKYVARLGPDMISVYEMPAVALLEKKSIAAKEILDFMWSPKSNMISYWSPAEANHPALINIIRVPERDEISSRKLFDVSEGRMVRRCSDSSGSSSGSGGGSSYGMVVGVEVVIVVVGIVVVEVAVVVVVVVVMVLVVVVVVVWW